LAVFLLAAIALAFLSLPALAEGRFALVIGNGAYKGVPALANPPNDAKDIAAALKSLGFTVTLGIDLDQAGMQRTIAEFAGQAAEADASLFYYAGARRPARGPQLSDPRRPQSCARPPTSGRARSRSIRCSQNWGRAGAAISSFSTPAATIPSPSRA